MDNQKVLGVDVGGSRIQIGLMGEQNMIIELRSYPTGTTDQDSVVKSIFDAVEQYWSAIAFIHKPAAIGISLVGHVSTKKGIWRNSVSLKIKEPVSICDTIRSRYWTPAYADNNVNVATLAEMKYGAGQHVDDFIYISIGTKIAAGLVSGGQLIRGASNYAGKIGHMKSNHVVGPDCKCGRSGCLEPVISGGGMIQFAKLLLQDYPTSTLREYDESGTLNAGVIYNEAKNGDVLSIMLVDYAVSALQETLVNIVNLLNPAMIVYGGAAIPSDTQLGYIKDYIYENALPVATRALKDICVSNLDARTLGLLGACTLARSRL